MKTIMQNTNQPQPKSTHAVYDIMQAVLDKAKALGATDASVGVSHDSGFAVDVRMGEAETVAFSEDRGVSMTAYIGQRKGSASSTDISPAAIDAMVRAAIDIASVSAADPCSGLPERELLHTGDYPDLDLYHTWDITPARAIEMGLLCESQALAIDKRIVNSDGVCVSTYQYRHGYANTHGAQAVVSSSIHSVTCSLVAKEGEGMQRDYDYTTARNPNALVSLEQLAKSAADRVTRRLGARPIKTQKAPVLFSPRLSSGLFSSFLGAISGSNLYRKNSFLLDTLGERIFPEFVRVYEEPHLLGGLGSAPIDAEGVPTRNNVFIEDGILQQYALGCYSARKLGLSTTANSGGVFNLTVDPTAGDLSDLVKQMGTGLLVTELMGQGVNILTGDYSRGASGFWVENGVIQYPVEGVTIAGNLREVFRTLVAVGRDINPNLATRCGSVLVAEMMVAGD